LKTAVKIIVGIVALLAVAAIVLSFFEAYFVKEVPEEAVAVASEAPAPPKAQEPAPEPEPEPMPIPDPEPLPIAKNENLPLSVLAPTTTMSFEELVGDNGIYHEEFTIPPSPSTDTYMLVVDEYHQLAIAYKRDENGEYTIPVRYMPTTTGARSSPTIKGTFNMRENYVRYGLFSCGVYGQYWRQITRAFYFHSLLYSRRNANTYTSSYNKLGTRASAGCVRMYVPDARWIFYNCAPGTLVTIQRGDSDDTQTAAIKAQLMYPERPDDRPGLQPGKIPVTDAWPGWQGDAYDAYLATLPAQPETQPDED